MKTPVLGLAVATVAFAGSSVYLWQQLGEARTRAAQVEETARKLNARVAELESARAQFTQRRMEAPGGFMTRQFGQGGPPPPPSADPSDEKKEGSPDKPTWTVMRRDPPPAMRRMMQNQVRMSTKRLYSDVGPKLGLGKDTATKLVDLLTEQQLANMDA